MSQAIQDEAFVAQALKAARVVDARVVAGPLKGALVDIWWVADNGHGSFRNSVAPKKTFAKLLMCLGALAGLLQLFFKCGNVSS